MNLGALIGLVLGFVILGSAAAIGAADAGVKVGLLMDGMSLAIVVGGAMAATAIAFPLPDLIGALGGFAKVFKGKDFTMKDIVQDYVNLAELARKGELAKALDEAPEHMPFRLGFIKDGIRMIADGMSKEDIRTILENQEQYRAMIGTLFGLVFMLGGMAVPAPPGVDPTAKLLAAMAIALITTLYGALFAFFFFLPFSDYMKYQNEEKKVESAMGLEGAMLLFDKVHPLIVRDRLNAFLIRKERLSDED